MIPFGYSSMRKKKLNFTVRIENFSMRSCRGSFVSPDTKWSLSVDMVDGDYSYVIMRLNREGNEEQLVSVKASVVDRFGSHTLTEKTEIFFNEDTCSKEILTLVREQLYGPISKHRLLPDDSLTLACELVVGQENVRNYEDNEERFESVLTPECFFARSYLMPRENLKFGWKFGDFKTLSRKGRLAGGTFGGEWSLVVYALDDYSQDFVEVRLRRENSRNTGDRFVNVKLSTVGHLPLPPPLSCERQVYFHDYEEEEIRLMTISKQNMSGLRKMLLMPGDALTLHCEIDTYEEVTHDDHLTKEDFLCSFRNQYGWGWWLAWWTSYVLLAALPLAVVYHLYGLILLPLLYDYILPFLGKVLVYLSVWYCLICVVLQCLYYVKSTAESCKRRKEGRQRCRENSNRCQELVPYQEQHNPKKSHNRQERVDPFRPRDISPYGSYAERKPKKVQQRRGIVRRRACYMNQQTGEYFYYSC